MATPYRGFPSDLERVAMYLRKSREDEEAEERARRDGLFDTDTLSRHRKRLFEIARIHNYNITAIFEEVVSGDLVDERPEMIRLLENVENGSFDAVLCVDIDRLGRGDSADQGIIQRAFRDASTLIITEDRVYDLQDDNDEEQVEFKQFFARRELKRITKRMQNGRKDSVKDGDYIGTYEPYGYYRDRNKGLKLLPGDRAEVVKLMFDWYVNEGIGTTSIADRLNAMGLPSPRVDYFNKHPGSKPVDPNLVWKASTVIQILKNEVYLGRIQWQKTRTVRRRLENGRYKKIKSVDRPKEEWLQKDNTHEALVDEKTFRAAQRILERRGSQSGPKGGMQNPLKGLVICRNCGGKMQRRPYQNQKPHLLCSNKGCIRSTRLEYVEMKLLEALRTWYQDYKIRYDKLEKNINKSSKKKVIPISVLDEVDRELAALQDQKNNLHTFLERGVYDVDTYMERNAAIMEEIKKRQLQKETLTEEIRRQEEKEEVKTNIIPLLRHVLDTYHATDDPFQKNKLLRSVIEKVVYFKADDWTEEHIELELHPLI